MARTNRQPWKDLRDINIKNAVQSISFQKGKGYHMSLSGIGNSNVNDVYTTTAVNEKTQSTVNKPETDKTTGTTAGSSTTKPDSNKTENKDTTTPAAVYDKTKLSEADRKSIVSQLKADQEKRQSQLTSLVQDMLSKQTNTFGKANNIWQFLAKGDYTVDAATKKKAQEDISEDGYWGVKQTSDRIVSFATALAGDDSKALEKMRDAFLKGYEKAEKTWGGKLPDISKRTYDAVLEKFDNLMKPKTEDKTPDKDNVTTTEDGTVVAKSE